MLPAIIINKEKRHAYRAIKYLGIDENGIIYGGMVRDEIIATHYKTKFDEYNVDAPDIKYGSFWDETYHPESKKRLLVPNDMDIFFANKTMADEFISKLTTFVSNYDGKMYIGDCVLYALDRCYTHKKINIYLKIGKTISSAGHSIRLEIDVIINNDELNIVEPPFNNADFTSNLFVMSKIRYNRYDIRLSRNTGTKLDTVSLTERTILQAKILKDIIDNKTEFIRKCTSPTAEYMNGMRIIKMLNHPHLQITNVLFIDIDRTPDIDDCICDICQISVKDESKSKELIKITTNKHAPNMMHKACFKEYLKSEIKKKYENPATRSIECKCTRRNLFNFKESYKYSSIYK